MCEKFLIERAIMKFWLMLLTVGLAACLGFVLGCGGNNDTSTDNDQIDYNAQKQEIIDIYHLWTEKLRLQDYDSAISLTTPGAGAFRYTQTAKEAWDAGGVLYWDFSYIEANWNADYEEIGYSEVYGNMVFYQYHSSFGEQIDSMGFASKCQRIGNEWRIDTFRSDYELYWWTK
jgi:hypothetical protein